MLPAPPRPWEAIGSVISDLRCPPKFALWEEVDGTEGRLGVMYGIMIAVQGSYWGRIFAFISRAQDGDASYEEAKGLPL